MHGICKRYQTFCCTWRNLIMLESVRLNVVVDDDAGDAACAPRFQPHRRRDAVCRRSRRDVTAGATNRREGRRVGRRDDRRTLRCRSNCDLSDSRQHRHVAVRAQGGTSRARHVVSSYFPVHSGMCCLFFGWLCFFSTSRIEIRAISSAHRWAFKITRETNRRFPKICGSVKLVYQTCDDIIGSCHFDKRRTKRLAARVMMPVIATARQSGVVTQGVRAV